MRSGERGTAEEKETGWSQEAVEEDAGGAERKRGNGRELPGHEE